MMSIPGMTGQPRGLHNFISEIRNCQSKDEERGRVDKELANIRSKFAVAGLSSYQKKKYVWKMCYIYMLGYDVDFGHVEFISLLSSTKFQEKSVGYMAISLLLKAGDPMMTLVVNSMRNDIVGSNLAGTTLALAAVANIGGCDLAETLAGDIQKLITMPAPTTAEAYQRGAVENLDNPLEYLNRKRCLIVKKASLCLLQLFRTNNDSIEIESWADPIDKLLGERDLGILTSAMSLLLGFTAVKPEAFESCIPSVVGILTRLVVARTCPADYQYYRIPSPWLQVKCLRFLQYYQNPTDKTTKDYLNDALNKILNRVGQDINTDSVNKSNAEHCILFESISLIISYGVNDADEGHREVVQQLLGKFIGSKDANIRYLALEALSRVARLEGSASVQDHIGIVMESLKDMDNSVRKRALDLLFVMADSNNCVKIVDELLLNLTMAESEMKDNFVVKIAIIAEKYSNDFKWYVDIMIQVILAAGDFVAEDVWFRIIHVITNTPDIQEYACERLLSSVKSKYAHETAICLAAYVLGEFGVNICEKPDMGGYEQFIALQQHYGQVSTKSKALLLTSYVKLMNLYPALKDMICEVLRKSSTSQNLEIQQRSCEYLRMPTISAEIMESVLDAMPVFKDAENSLEKKMKATEIATRIITKAAPGAAASNQDDDSRGHSSVNSASNAPQVNLLSLDDDFMSSPSSSNNGYDPSLEPAVKKNYNTCLLLNGPTSGQKGILFEDTLLKVTVFPMYSGHQSRYGVIFTNKGSDEITQFSVKLSHDSGTAGVEALVFQRTAEPQSRMMSIEDAKMQFNIACMRPFIASPVMTVNFTCRGKAFVYPLTLPVLATHFCDGVGLNRDVYMQRWKSLEGAEKEAQEVFTSIVKPLNGQVMAQIRQNVFSTMHLAVAEGVDTENTFTGCATFKTGTMGADGVTPVIVGVMVRIEGDFAGGRFRVTVRSSVLAIAQAVKNAIKCQLAAP